MTTTAPPERPVLLRRSQGRAIGGVCTGLAAHLGVGVLPVRAAFLVMTIAGGSGVLAYAVFWVVLPLEDGPPPSGPLRIGWSEIAVLAGLVVTGLLLLQLYDVSGLPVLPVLAAGVGVALVWRQADTAQRARWRATATGERGRFWPSVVGVALLVAGGIGFLRDQGELRAAQEGLLSTFVVVGGLALLALPWLVRNVNDLRAERLARIRSQERTELAAQVHDSVPQTLALIQRAADDPREVARLARVQERELRAWLYQPASAALTFGRALEQAAAEVEEAHGVPVEVVVVGDAPGDDRLAALVSASREAVVNASKHSGAPLVQVYAEVEPGQVTVFVRDRGRGFDPALVPAGRYGLAESVVGRMARAGGEARVRSEPGDGTEVRLQVPRG